MFTLCLEGGEILSEGVYWALELEKGQVAMFPHLRFLILMTPHSHYNLTKTQSKSYICVVYIDLAS